MYYLKALLNWINSQGAQAGEDTETGRLVFFFEQEIGWLVSNVVYGPKKVVHALFFDDEASLKPSTVVLEFLRSSFESKQPSKLQNALYITANATGDSEEIGLLLMSHVNLFGALYETMLLGANHTLISIVMWNLQNLVRFNLISTEEHLGRLKQMV